MNDLALAFPDGTEVLSPPTVDATKYRLSRSLAVLSAPGSAQAESIGTLRTFMNGRHLRDHRRALAVCGPAPGVGCTYIATNMAVAMAMTGVKTLLIDGNLRSSGIEEVICPLQDGPTLRDCLSADAPRLDEAIRHDVLPNLSVMYAGGRGTDAQELVARDNLKHLLASCMRDFDLTIIDTPPGNSCADARVIAAAARYAMVVVRRNATFVSDVQYFVDELQTNRAVVVGSFLNDF